MTTYATSKQILAEIDQVLSKVDEAQIQALCDALTMARRIFVYGLGREGLVMRSFAMRLMHLGLNVAVVGDMTTPPISLEDVFLVSCGPGYLATVQALMSVARQAGGRIVMVTAQPQALLSRQADLLVNLPAQTMAEADKSSSAQAMGSAFEQAMWVLFDALMPRLQSALGQTADNLRQRHTNLE